MQQVHKEELKEVDNVPDNLAARRDPNIEIFGMTGVPDHILKAREDTIREQFAKREYEWRILTGNPLPGTETPEQAQAPKRVKVESKEDLKRRVQELKAKRAAEKAARESGIPIPAAATSPANPSGTLSSPATPSDPAREATLTPPAATHYLPPGQALPPYNLGYPPVNYGLPAYSPAVYGYNGAPPGLAMSANTPHPLPFHTAPPGFSNLPNGYHPHALPTHPQAPNGKFTFDMPRHLHNTHPTPGAGTMSPGAQVDHRQPSNQTSKSSSEEVESDPVLELLELLESLDAHVMPATSYQKTPMNVAPLGFEAAFEGLMDRAQAALQDNTLEDPDHKKSNDAPKASANDNVGTTKAHTERDQLTS
jgi:hypothetical protein